MNYETWASLLLRSVLRSIFGAGVLGLLLVLLLLRGVGRLAGVIRGEYDGGAADYQGQAQHDGHELLHGLEFLLRFLPAETSAVVNKNAMRT